MIRRPPRSTPLYSSAASDVYKRQRFLRSSPPCHPFADDTQGTLESPHLYTAPELRPISTARGPLRVQKRQVSVKRALPDPKDIRALATADLANELTAVPGSADDFLERHPVPNERHDRRIGLRAGPGCLNRFSASISGASAG